MKNNKFSNQQTEKPFKYQRCSLNIIIMNVRSNVLFSKFIDVVIKLIYLHLNLNYSIHAKLDICIKLVVMLNLNYLPLKSNYNNSVELHTCI